MKNMVIKFYPDEKEITVRKGTSLLDAVRQTGIKIESLCGGRGICGKCKVVIEKGAKELNELTNAEKRKLSKKEIIQGYRLACCSLANGDMMVRIPEESRGGTQRVLIKGVKGEKKSIEVESSETLDGNYGIALDIGTTTVVGYLVDLNNSKLLEASSILNPQVEYGEDVMTRITFTMQNSDGLKKLNKSIIGGVNKIVKDVCSKARVKPEEISELTVVGNTVMHHLFLGLCPRHLGVFPFTPIIQNSINMEAQDLGINVKPVANVYVLPVIAGFVGADNVGVILATQINESNKPVLAMDLGTNGEIVLGDKKGITVCSCAAGPAFEGAHIKFGMRAAVGAIERVKINPKTLEVKCSIIGNVTARGLCGSGIVDAVAELLKAGVILRNGRINPKIESPRLRTTEESAEFILAGVDETATEREITITQKDIREVQLAKAAMYAGASILMKRCGIRIEEMDSLLLAGAFGNYINKANAKIMGLYPDIPLDKVRMVGNAAGAGARATLISKKARVEADFIAKHTSYVELTVAPEFEGEFMAAMYFPHSDVDRFPSLKGYFGSQKVMI